MTPFHTSNPTLLAPPVASPVDWRELNSRPLTGEALANQVAMVKGRPITYRPGSKLCDKHRADLHRSTWTEETIHRAGVVTSEEPPKDFLGPGRTFWGPSLRMSHWDINGANTGDDIYRLDRPIPGKSGKLMKYVARTGSRPRLYFSPLVARDDWNDPTRPIIFTEGIKKANAIAQLGYLPVSANGVSLFHDVKHRRSSGEYVLNEDANLLQLNRTCVIMLDGGDTTWNRDVIRAEQVLAQMLIARGAKSVLLARLPFRDTGSIGCYYKNGVDDFLADVPEPWRGDAFRWLIDTAIPYTAPTLTPTQFVLEALRQEMNAIPPEKKARNPRRVLEALLKRSERCDRLLVIASNRDLELATGLHRGLVLAALDQLVDGSWVRRANEAELAAEGIENLFKKKAWRIAPGNDPGPEEFPPDTPGDEGDDQSLSLVYTTSNPSKTSAPGEVSDSHQFSREVIRPQACPQPGERAGLPSVRPGNKLSEPGPEKDTAVKDAPLLSAPNKGSTTLSAFEKRYSKPFSGAKDVSPQTAPHESSQGTSHEALQVTTNIVGANSRQVQGSAPAKPATDPRIAPLLKHDAFRRGWSVKAAMFELMGAPVSAAVLMYWNELSKAQAHKHLKEMAAHGLVVQPKRGLWQAVVNSALLDAVAKKRGMVGVAQREKARIAAEREDWTVGQPGGDR